MSGIHRQPTAFKTYCRMLIKPQTVATQASVCNATRKRERVVNTVLTTRYPINIASHNSDIHILCNGSSAYEMLINAVPMYKSSRMPSLPNCSFNPSFFTARNRKKADTNTNATAIYSGTRKATDSASVARYQSLCSRAVNRFHCFLQ